MTILVEAKTTKKNYSLPAKDARALRDYVADVRGGLAAFPQLSLILLIGNAPAKTLEMKLARLESHTTTPVRYITAKVLTTLRSGLPGMLHVGRFVDRATGARTRILTDDFAKELVENAQKEQKLYSDFVQQALTLGRLP